MAGLFFAGGAAQAVQQSKAQRQLLVVFLKGKDGLSAEVERLLVDPEVAGLLSEAIVLRLDDDLEEPESASADAKRFRSIPAYQTDTLPTVGVIGTSGAPLVWLKGGTSKEELSLKLEEGKEAFAKQVQAELAMAAFATMMAQQQAQQPPSAATPPAPTSPPLTLPGPEEVAAATRDARRRAEERTALAMEEEKRRQALKKEKERQAAEEAVLQAARQEELAKQRAAEEKRRKEQAEERKKELAVEASRAAAAAAEAQGVAHLAFRLLNGESIKGTFDISASLSEAAAWVDANRTDGSAPYTLMVPYPKRAFVAEDHGRTLKELGLAPRAALMLSAVKGGTAGGGKAAGIASAGSAGGAQASQSRTWGQFLGGAVGGVARTVGGVLSYVNPLAYTGGPQYAADPAREAAIRAQQGQQAADAAAGRASSGGGGASSSGSGSSKRKAAAAGGGGWGANVATLRHDDDDREDKDNKFWNGNSTQFGGDDPKK